MTKHRGNRPEWEIADILQRVERARGAHLARTGQEVRWSVIGRALAWPSSTTSDVRTGRRALRIPEIGAIAALLQCSAGWLAFNEGTAPAADADARRVTMHRAEAAAGESSASPQRTARADGHRRQSRSGFDRRRG